MMLPCDGDGDLTTQPLSARRSGYLRPAGTVPADTTPHTEALGTMALQERRASRQALALGHSVNWRLGTGAPSISPASSPHTPPPHTASWPLPDASHCGRGVAVWRRGVGRVGNRRGAAPRAEFGWPGPVARGPGQPGQRLRLAVHIPASPLSMYGPKKLQKRLQFVCIARKY